MKKKTKKIKVKPEGRNNIWIPEKKSIKNFIVSKNIKQIHNFMPAGNIMLGADHTLESVLKDIDSADRIAIFTDPTANMGHSMALIEANKLECYDIGKITIDDLLITE